MKRTSLLTSALLLLSLNAGASNMNEIIVPTGALPTGMSKVQYQGAVTESFGDAGQIQTNVRAVSAKSTLADYWVIQYAASQTSFGLTPVKADVYPGVGVYYEQDGLFMKDVNPNGALTLNGAPLTWGRLSLKTTLSSPVVANLETGSSVSVYSSNAGVPYFLVVTELATKKVIYSQPGFPSATYHWPVNILRGGKYSFAFVAVGSTAPVTAQVRFTHNNASKTIAVKNGQTFSTSLSAYSFSYAKLKVTLKAGQKVKLNITLSNHPVNVVLVASDNTLVAADGNLVSRSTLVMNPVPAAGDYYLVFRKPYSTAGAMLPVVTNGVIEVLN